MTPDILAAIPNLGVGVAAVLAIYMICKLFIEMQNRREVQFRETLEKRESEMRALEKEVRTTIVAQLSSASHVMNRMVDFLDRQEMHDRPRITRR